MSMYKAGIYARISVSESKNDKDSTSIINQKEIIKDYCFKNSINIYDYYIDDGYSGGTFDRPEFKRMISDIENGLINVVITKDISRLGRDFIGTGNYIYKYFPNKNVRYIAILDNYDSNTPALSDDIIPFKAVLNDMYLKDISTKIKKSRHELMRKGFYMGSTVPFGYKRSESNSRVLEIDPVSSNIVKRIFNLKASGYSSTMIARTLTNDKIYPPNIYNNRANTSNMIWTSSTIDYIIRNPVYLGNLIQRKYERISLKSKRKRLLNESEWIKGFNLHEAIIDENLFNLVNKKKDIVRYKRYDYLLKGLVKCNECMKTMIVRRTKSGNIYCCRTYAKYRDGICTMHYFREDILNELVKKEVLNILNSKSLLNIYKRVLDKIKDNSYLDKKVKDIKLDIDKNNKVLVSLYKDKVNDVLTNEDYEIIRESVLLDLKKLKEKLDILLSKSKTLDCDIKRMYEDFLKLNNKGIFHLLLDKITIDKEKKVRIFYRFMSL